MVSQLEAELKRKVARAFRGKLTKGKLRRVTSTAVDNKGNPVVSAVSYFSFQSGIRETYSAFYKANSGIPDTDVSILVLNGSFTPKTVVTKADEGNLIYLGKPWNAWYQIRRYIDGDPADASVKMQCYEVDAPIDPTAEVVVPDTDNVYLDTEAGTRLETESGSPFEAEWSGN